MLIAGIARARNHRYPGIIKNKKRSPANCSGSNTFVTDREIALQITSASVCSCLRLSSRDLFQTSCDRVHFRTASLRHFPIRFQILLSAHPSLTLSSSFSSCSTSSLSIMSSGTPLELYEPLDIIGNGSFGVIRKVRRKADGVVSFCSIFSPAGHTRDI